MSMLLTSFNFIGWKEIMKLLRNFHLMEVNQNFFLIFRAGAFTIEQFKKNKINKIQLYIKSE